MSEISIPTSPLTDAKISLCWMKMKNAREAVAGFEREISGTAGVASICSNSVVELKQQSCSIHDLKIIYFALVTFTFLISAHPFPFLQPQAATSGSSSSAKSRNKRKSSLRANRNCLLALWCNLQAKLHLQISRPNSTLLRSEEESRAFEQ